jgi:hypothetical protein
MDNFKNSKVQMMAARIKRSEEAQLPRLEKSPYLQLIDAMEYSGVAEYRTDRQPGSHGAICTSDRRQHPAPRACDDVSISPHTMTDNAHAAAISCHRQLARTIYGTRIILL